MILDLALGVIPLYLIILLGYISIVYLKADGNTISRITIYIVGPVVTFNAIINAKLTASLVSMPIIMFSLCSIIAVIFLSIGKRFYQDKSANLLAFASAAGNTGYFGLPVLISLFGSSILPLAIMANFGMSFFEASVGYYILAKGNYSSKESLVRLLKMPILIAFTLGVFANLLGLVLPESLQKTVNHFTGAYVVLGMMIVGIGIASLKSEKKDYTFLTLGFIARFLIWPIGMTLMLLVEHTLLGSLDTTQQCVLMILASVPVAAATVSWASIFNNGISKAALLVVASTICSIFFLPLMVYVLNLLNLY